MSTYVRWAFIYASRGVIPLFALLEWDTSHVVSNIGTYPVALCHFSPRIARCLSVQPAKLHLVNVLYIPSPFFTDFNRQRHYHL